MRFDSEGLALNPWLVALGCLLIGLLIGFTQWFLLIPLPFLVLFGMIWPKGRFVWIPVVLIAWLAALTVRNWEPHLFAGMAVMPLSLILIGLIENFD